MDFTRFGGDLLSHALRRSTIGATVLNFRVRDGTGCFTCAMTTKPRKIHIRDVSVLRRRGDTIDMKSKFCVLLLVLVSLTVTGTDQAYRAISTGQLNALLHLHLRPIDEVVYLGPQGYLVLRGASRLDAFSGYPVRS